MPKLSDQFRTAIRSSGFPLARLCEQIGIDQGTGSRFMAGQCGLSIETLDRLAEVLDLEIAIPSQRRFAMLANTTVGEPRLRFINNEFSELVFPPIGKVFAEWESEERQRLQATLGPKTTLSHYTCDILKERPTDSVGLCNRRKSIPPEVFEKFGPNAE